VQLVDCHADGKDHYRMSRTAGDPHGGRFPEALSSVLARADAVIE